jgi:hypothetical protein
MTVPGRLEQDKCKTTANFDLRDRFRINPPVAAVWQPAADGYR